MTEFDTFGDLLKFLRRRARLTQGELAISVGYSREHIARLENNQRLPDLTALKALFLPALAGADNEGLAERLLALAVSARERAGSAPRSLPSDGTGLPALTTRFIGREQAIRDVQHLLSIHRLVALTGAGGVGKTRLAVQVGLALKSSFTDGVRLAELALVANPELVTDTVALAVGLPAETNRPVLAALVDFLHSKRMLLILDNCEHLLVACANLVEALLRAAPDLHILATSRESFGLLSAATWRVPSLSQPDPWKDANPQPTVERLLEAEAVQLFLDRAQAVKPDFNLTSRNAQAVVAICRRLDGIPLAIELASTRLHALSASQIAARLNDRFHLLAGDAPAGLARHQTLRAIIDWSYALLSADETALLRQLSVFIGGWTLEAVERLGQSLTGAATFDALKALTGLVNKSMVVFDGQEDTPRYSLLETVRAYALEMLLEAGEQDQAQAVHLAYYTTLVETIEPQLRGPQQLAGYRCLEMEHDNIRAALGWAVMRGDGPVSQRLVAGIWFFWFWRGYWSEGAAWVERVVALESGENPLNKAKSLIGGANLAGRAGDYEHLVAWLAEGQALAETAGDLVYMAWAHTTQSVLTADHQRAAALLQQAIDLSLAAGDLWLAGDFLFMLGDRQRAAGDFVSAQASYTRSAALFRQLGDRMMLANPTGNQGRIAFQQGDYLAARSAFAQSVALSRETANRPGMANWLLQLAAAELYLGNDQSAQAALGECLALCREIGNAEAVADCFVIAAGLAHARGERGDAARWLGAADRILEQFNQIHHNIDTDSYQAFLSRADTVRCGMEKEAFQQAWSVGAEMAMDAVIAEILAGD